MARAYTVGTVALALAIPAKWIDNVLSHHTLDGVAQLRQGVARKVSVEGVLKLALTRALVEDLGLPTAAAIRLASTIGEGAGKHRTPTGLTIELDLSAFRAELEARLAHAVEITPIPNRGRPRQAR